MKRRARKLNVRRTSRIGFLLLILVFASCKQGTFYAALGDQIAYTPVIIAPAAATLLLGSSLTFSASGGVPPYTYSVVSGTGWLNGSTGIFTAGAVGTVIVQVSDKNKITSDATLTVTPTGAFTINPAAVSVNVNGTIQFAATGGTPPYKFSITTIGSGSPTINSGSGLYKSGSTLGIDKVTVTDASAMTTATVNVTAAATSVDYTIQSVTLPGGTGGKDILAVNTFTVQNIGVAGGSRPLSWWVYLSDSPTFDSAGAQILASGNVTVPLLPPASGTTTIPITGTWPVVPVPAGETKYLFFQIAADDDLNSSNNFAVSLPVVILPPKIDYTVTWPAHTGPLVEGGPINENFTLQNILGDTGSQTVYWTAYVSTNALPTVSGDTVIAVGNHGFLGPSPACASINIAGTWPSAPGPYYLKVQLSAADDIDTTNDLKVSIVFNTTHVDYTPVQVQLSGPGQVAGGPLSGEFKIQNLGNANGTLPVAWTAYVAPVLTPNLVTFLSSSTFPGPVNAGPPSAFIPFSGTWPTTPGNYVLIVSVTSPEDAVAANNVGTSAVSYDVIAPHVDYAVSAVTNTGAATAPVMGAMSGSFHLTNNGPDNGTQWASWSAYASPSGAVDSSAVLIISGVTPPLVSSGSTDISFSGQWPMRYGNYKLVVSVSAPVDVDSNLANNVAASLATAAVGFINEAESNDDVATAQNLGLTLQPGISVLVTRSSAGADMHDVFTFNTGTASSVSLYMSWSGSATVTLSFYKDSVTPVPPTATTLTGSSLILPWNVDLPGIQRWIDVANPGGETEYTLIITGN